MKKIILHIGVPKTGSSALQVLLARNYDALLERSIDYFQIGDFNLSASGKISSGNGALLARSLLPPGNPIALHNREQHLHILFDAIAASNADIGIISSEIFVDAAPPALMDLSQRLEERGIAVETFFYVRRQDQFLASAYIQQVKRHGYKELPEIFIRQQHQNFPYLNYNTLFSYLENVFGSGSVKCRVYDEAIKSESGLFLAFLNAFEVDPEGLVLTTGDINTSLSNKDLAIMLMLNQLNPRMQFSDIVVENAIKFGATKAGITHTLFSRATLQLIEVQFEDENARLAQQYFKRPNLFLAKSSSHEALTPISGASLSFEDVIRFLGGVVVQLDSRVAALAARINKLEAGSGQRKSELDE